MAVDNQEIDTAKKLTLAHAIDRRSTSFICAHLCVCTVLCNFVTCVHLCNNHHSRGKELLCHHKISLVLPLYNHTPRPPLHCPNPNHL